MIKLFNFFIITLFLFTFSYLLIEKIFYLDSSGYRGKIKKNYNGTYFKNLEPIHKNNFLFFLNARFFSNTWHDWPKEITNKVFVSEKSILKVAEPIKFTWIGHSSVLIQLDNLNILTDPIWSQRCSPFSWIGPKRVSSPGLKIKDLPKIDLVLISHNHYDHMDIPTLKKLQEKFNMPILVGLGNRQYLEKQRLKKIREFDWWESYFLKGKKITFVPAQHFSSRGLFDRMKTLWGGFIIERKNDSIYFAGDTGYGKFFKSIKEKFKPISIAFLPIGAYKPKFFMSPVHLSPEDAVRAYIDLEANQAVGIHFETFRLSAEKIEAPKKDLIKSLNKKKIDLTDFIIPQRGIFYKN